MKLADSLFAQIRRSCEDAYPEEACGVVWLDADAAPAQGGDGERLAPIVGPPAQVRALANVQNALHAADPITYDRDARTAYALSPADEIWVDGLSRRLLVVWHSHPDHDAYFSDTDLRRAAPPQWGGEATYPWVTQIVVSVRQGRLADARAFRWCEDEHAFVDEELEVIP
jgi:proteasome lid subunit RPN8/RPN11